MQTIKSIDIKDIIKNSLTNSMSYSEYTYLMNDLVEAKTTTGSDKSEVMVEYTRLNQKRMKRWDKTLKIHPDTQMSISSYTETITWLVITESWCGDAAHIIPVINKVAELNDNINLKLVLRDDNEQLMNAFLTNGGKSIPKMIALDDNLDVLYTFGPRSSYATKLVEEYKADYGKLTPEFKEELQRWYNKDKGQSTVEDLVALLKV